MKIGNKLLSYGVLGLSALALSFGASAQNGPSDKANPNDRAKEVVDHWTSDKIESVTPRDLYLDHRGLGYIRGADGKLKPYGHNKPMELKQEKLEAAPRAKPGGAGGGNNSDSTPPTITGLSPTSGSTIGASQVFEATVTDAGGVRSVTFNLTYTGGSGSFDATNVGGDVWQVSLSGFPDGPGSYSVTATDNAKRGGNSATSETVNFTVDTGNGGGGGDTGGGDIVVNERWANGGDIQTAAGRLFYEMPTDRRLRRWAGYVCSGTVATDQTTGRSIIITAAHCVYNDQYKAFARNVLFIPNQDQTTGTATDTNCSNDPVGCWVASFGVVDTNWTTRTFPDNIPWDYAYYVVEDTGAHIGNVSSSDALDTAVGSFDVSFAAPVVDDGTAGPTTPDYTHALGYSYADDPFFMYCAEDMTTEGTDNWWLPSCGLSGGSSGGPWLQPMDVANGTGTVMSVNSWGYTTGPGMAGPKLNGSSAQCLFNEAKTTFFNAVLTQDGEQGIAVGGCQ